MNHRERIFAVLNHEVPDRIPRFEVWIDALYAELGVSDPISAYAELGQDAVLMPSQSLAESNAWKSGVDEWGRVWKDGMYTGGVLETAEDLVRYSPPLLLAQRFFDPLRVEKVRQCFPEYCLFFGTHIGPFMNSYMAMGLDRFCLRLADDTAFIHALMEARTEWCLAVFGRAVELGAEVIVMGDDSAHHGGPMISPRMWREFVLPYHRRIVETLPVPVIWHSDGNIAKLLPMAVEAGFAGIHGLEPWSMSLSAVKAEYGGRLALIGNVDVRLLCDPDLDKLRDEMRRCIQEGGKDGYMFSSCNSIFTGMNPAAAREFFRYQAELTGVDRRA
jgi:uroporphyrinogen-III decarboxylase